MSFESVLGQVLNECPGALGVALMGSDGIPIAQVAVSAPRDLGDEVSLLGIEFGRLLDEARKAAGAAGAGGVQELAVQTERFHVLLQALDRPIRQVQSMSRPLHQPATVGRSWVEVIAAASRSHRSGGLKPPRPVRSNHSTRMPSRPRPVISSWKPGGMVPRSSPTTIARASQDSRASSRSRSSCG